MSKRLIGIEVGDRTLRVAVLNREKGQISVGSLLERTFTESQELTSHLREILSGPVRMGDQLITSLPARSVYVRTLQFPFQDEKKIAAAVPFELSSQLPVSIETCATAIQQAQKTAEGATVVAAAVPKATLEPLLALFDDAGVPLHMVDVRPYCYVAGLGGQFGDAILVCASEQETTVALLINGHVMESRTFSAETETASSRYLQQLVREIRSLTHTAVEGTRPLVLIGSRISKELAEALQESEHPVEVLSLELGNQVIEGPFLPAVALALRAKIAKNNRSFNFRSGQYALKGEWANLKKRLVVLAAMFAMAVSIMAGSMALKYADKAGRLSEIQTEMTSVYQTLFPEATTIVDVPLQMKSAIRELQEKGTLVSGNQASVLAVLKEVSRLPELVTVEFQELALSAAELKLSGHAASFEAVNKMAEALGESPLFATIQVSDAKMSLDGSRIDFRLLIGFSGRGDER